MNIRLMILLIAAISVTALIWFLADRFPGSLDSDYDQASLVRAVGIMALLAAGLIISPRLNLKGAMKYAVIWLLVGLAILTAYTLRDDFMTIGKRLGGEIAPSMAVESGTGTITLKRSRDGHFRINAEVNGTPVQFLIDTGASVVTLSKGDAARAGIDPANLDYNRQYQTAGGTAWGASVRLDRVTLGSIGMDDVRAAVIDSSLSSSLLGMSFLERLGSFSVEGDTMTLRK
ncbi:MAG: TIGR02281 family clan AA aspartic protease [Rhodospirillales bacterium]